MIELERDKLAISDEKTEIAIEVCVYLSSNFIAILLFDIPGHSRYVNMAQFVTQ